MEKIPLPPERQCAETRTPQPQAMRQIQTAAAGGLTGIVRASPSVQRLTQLMAIANGGALPPQGPEKQVLQPKGVAVNDDPVLEREADEMGAKAMEGGMDSTGQVSQEHGKLGEAALTQRVVQRMIYLREDGQISFPLNASSKVAAANVLGASAKSAHGELMAQYAEELGDADIRVVDKEALAAWLRENAGSPNPAPIPFEGALNPDEFPVAVTNYIRNVGGYMLTPGENINVTDGPAAYKIGMAWLPSVLRMTNLVRRKREGLDKTTNVVSAGLTITYTDGSGDTQIWQSLIPGGWKSGNYKESHPHARQDSQKASSADSPAGPLEASSAVEGALEAHDHVGLENLDEGALGGPVEEEIELPSKRSEPQHSGEAEAGPLPPQPKEPSINSYHDFLKVQPHIGRFKRSASLSRSVENAKAGNVDANSMYHSENAFAYDAEKGRLNLASPLDRFLADCNPTQVLSVVLEVDSHPNTMCVNMCRASIDAVRQHVHQFVGGHFPHGLLSPHYMTHSRVHAETAFKIGSNRENAYKSHKGTMEKGPNVQLGQVPFGQQGAPTGFGFEVWWGKDKAAPQAPSSKRKSKGDEREAFFSASGQQYQIREPRVPGDGNCFFECMSRLLHDGRDHAAMRAALATHMGDQSISANRAWAEDHHIHGMAAMLGCTIFVHVISYDGTELTVQRYGNGNPVYRIANIGYSHFELLDVAPAQAALGVVQADAPAGKGKEKSGGEEQASKRKRLDEEA